MRINNNIMALNAHRQLGINQGGAAKSMEKLSSGFRINRAGDDAAGLAISEKMRGQIRGLKQATRNAQDGISLLQTAEGALNESHAILQRMRELANQAANDTNVEADRGEIQKEINQLTSELNRIGNTTEFNTQKLLDGGGAPDPVSQTVNSTKTGGKAGAIDASVITQGSTGKSTAEVTLANGNVLTIAAKEHGTTLDGYIFKFEHHASNESVVRSGKVVTVTANLDALTVDGLQAMFDGAGLGVEEVVVSAVASGGVAIAGSDAIGFVNTDDNNATTSAMTGGADSATKGSYAFDVTDAFLTEASDIVTFTLGDGTEVKLTSTEATTDESNFAIGTEAARLSAEEQAENIKDALLANATVSTGYDVSVEGNRILLTEKVASNDKVETEVAPNNAVAGTMTYEHETVLEAGEKFIVDGVEISVVDDANEYKDEISAGTAVLKGDSAATQLENIKTAINRNAELNGKYEASIDSGALKLEQQAGAESNKLAEIQTQGKGEGGSGGKFTANFQIGANFAQSMTVEFEDMRASALGVAGKTESAEATANDGAKATYTSIKNVTDGTTNVDEEYALDVSDHDKATAAISVLDDAIEKVSAERSKMGAYQNRLEHTIANLGTSAENLQAAESRIRDLDMAEEIMAFTKNNILQQAATAMLAQANMAPQSVLQLLG